MMSGDKLRASGWMPIKSDALPFEVVEAVNGLGERVESLGDRFDTFHGELSLMRGMLGDLVPRMTTVETRTLGAKVGGGAVATVKWGGYISLALVVLNQLVKRFPELQVVADVLKGLVAL
jgi:hypothetical protein